ncbi:hypothetical protein MNBD_GAMMA01-1800 [hydrothermal vent metagenome]|uniref:Uncharacterized protein n=1 Tax=hydrothermal vent metagenome TaxID=652676 RepID=A0A3B0V649_9ZZZZ
MKILILLITLIAALTAKAQNCKELYQQHLKTDMLLSYKEFDQTMGKGFRSMASNLCDKEAADLIEKYIEVNNAKQSSLRWHIAQLRAHTGDYSVAVKWAKTVLQDKEDFSKQALRWNDYVLATIAFLEHDKKSLIAHRNNVAKGKEDHFGNALNLKYLDSLIKYFDKSYKFASNNVGK